MITAFGSSAEFIIIFETDNHVNAKMCILLKYSNI